MKNSCLRPIFAGLCTILVLTETCGASYSWTGGSAGAGDAWRHGGNWSPSTGRDGPGSGETAVFSTNGSASDIGINFNPGLGRSLTVGSIVLADGPSRTIFNSSGNSAGTLQIEGVQGQLIAHHAPGATLTFQHGSSQALEIRLLAAGAIEVGSADSAVVLAARVAGTNGFAKTGHGALRLTHSNALTGSVVVSGGTLELAAAQGGALGNASLLRLESGASAVLVAAQQLGAGTAIDLAGGTLRGADGETVVEEHAGTLTLSASSTIDLGASAIRFADSSAITWEAASILTITNWRGAAGGGLFFGVGGLDSTQLSQIYFADIGVQGAQLVGPDGELTPIPEAPVTAAAVVLAAFIVWRERRRLGRVLRYRFLPRPDASVGPARKSRSADG